MSEHTKTPFEVVETYGEMIDSDFQALIGNRVGAIAWVCDERYARHIVHCVNNHELVKRKLKTLRDSISGDCYMGEEWELETIDELLAALEAEKGGE